VAVSWQVAFLIAQDPARYRPLMIPAVLEKATFGIAVLVLFAQQASPACCWSSESLILCGYCFSWRRFGGRRAGSNSPPNRSL